MMSLHRYFPCLRYDVSSLRSRNIDKELDKAEGDLIVKRTELHAAAKEFEATVQEFLEDNKRIKALPND